MANENFILLPKSIWESVCDDIAIIKNRLEVICPAADCDEYLSSEEARKFLGVSKRTWQTYRDQHRVPFSIGECNYITIRWSYAYLIVCCNAVKESL